MENKEKLLERVQELKKGLNLLSRERKVVMPHNKAFDHVDQLKAKVDEIIKQGEDAGFIKFGSRVDLFLPLDSNIKVKLNDKVKGGESIIST